MFSKKHRLSKTVEVKQTTARGRSFFNPNFVLKMAKGVDIPKITVIISTKVSKKAVVRNKVKRIIRDEVRKQIPFLTPGFYAFIVKPKAVTINSKELREEVIKTLTTSRAIKK